MKPEEGESTGGVQDEVSPWFGWPHRSWRYPWGTTLFLAFCAVLYSWVAFLADGDRDASAYHLLLSGAKINQQVWGGEWWRVISASFLHGQVTHLILNAVGIALLGWFVESVVGAAGLWAVAVVSGTAGNLLSAFVSPFPSVGASGAMYGLLGAALVLVWRRWGKLPTGQRLYLVAIPGSLGLGALVFGLISDDVNQYLHGGGLLAGAVAGLAVSAWVRDETIRSLGRYAVLLTIALTGFAMLQTSVRLWQPVVLVTHELERQDLPGLPPFLSPAGWAAGAFVEGACEVGVAATNGTSACFVDPFHAVLVVGRHERMEHTPMGTLAESSETLTPIEYAEDTVFWQVDDRRDLAFALLAYRGWSPDYGALFAAVGADPDAAGFGMTNQP